MIPARPEFHRPPRVQGQPTAYANTFAAKRPIRVILSDGADWRRWLGAAS